MTNAVEEVRGTYTFVVGLVFVEAKVLHVLFGRSNLRLGRRSLNIRGLRFLRRFFLLSTKISKRRLVGVFKEPNELGRKGEVVSKQLLLVRKHHGVGCNGWGC